MLRLLLDILALFASGAVGAFVEEESLRLRLLAAETMSGMSDESMASSTSPAGSRHAVKVKLRQAARKRSRQGQDGHATS